MDGGVPDFTGCKPSDIRAILRSYEYELAIENHVASETVRSGRIVSQRAQSGMVYVDVSTGPAADERPNRVLGVVVDMIGGLLANPPQPNPQPPPTAVTPQPPPPPDRRLTDVMTVPPPPVEPAPAPPRLVEPAPPQPQPAPTQPEPTRNPVVQNAQATQPQTDSAPAPQTTAPAPQPITETTSLQPGTDIPPLADQQLQRPIPPPLPPSSPSVFRIFLQGSANSREGDELVLSIRREGRDGFDHRLGLAYSDRSLLASPPSTFEFRAGLPDEVAVRLRTVVAEDRGDHQLVVRLAGIDRAKVGQPDSVTALILDRTPWWKKLLQALASLPVWAAVLAGAAAAAGLGLYLFPRATCSIGGGSVDLGAQSLENRWPRLSIDTVIGDPSFSIPSPLPIGRRRDAEPSSN